MEVIRHRLRKEELKKIRRQTILLAALIAIVISIVIKGVFAWTNPTQAPPGGSGILPAQYVTSLPSSPVDGQEVYYVVDSTNKVIWHLRYNADSSSSYKWEFIGGPPLYSEVEAYETTSSGSYTDLATPGPSLTVPRGGEYYASFGYLVQPDYIGYAAWATPKYGSAAPSDANGIYRSGYHGTAERTDKKTLTGGDLVKLQYKVGNTMHFEKRWLSLQPIRIQ